MGLPEINVDFQGTGRFFSLSHKKPAQTEDVDGRYKKRAFRSAFNAGP